MNVRRSLRIRLFRPRCAIHRFNIRVHLHSLFLIVLQSIISRRLFVECRFVVARLLIIINASLSWDYKRRKKSILVEEVGASRPQSKLCAIQAGSQCNIFTLDCSYHQKQEKRRGPSLGE